MKQQERREKMNWQDTVIPDKPEPNSKCALSRIELICASCPFGDEGTGEDCRICQRNLLAIAVAQAEISFKAGFNEAINGGRG